MTIKDEPTTKSIEEQFYDEAILAVSGNDTTALNALMNDSEEDEPTKEAPVEEVIEDTEEDTTTEEAAPAEESANVESENPADTIATLKQQLEEAKQLEHKHKSDAGRVPGLQRKLAELDKKLAELSAPNRVASSEEDAALLNTDALRVLEATDPELAKAIRDSMRQVYDATTRENISRTREVTNTFMQAQHEEQLQSEMNKLLAVVPNAPDVFQSQEWHSWVDSRSPGMRGLATSDYADEVLIALREFSNSFGMPSVIASKPTISAPAENRSQRLKVQTPGSTRAAPSGRSQDLDEASIFNKIYNDLLAQNKRR